MRERSDAEWVEVLKQDSSPVQREAYQDLGTYLHRVVCNYIWKRGTNLPGLAGLDRREQEALAKGFVQEALLTIYQKLDQYRGEGSLLAWATTIAVRIAGDELRKTHWRSPRIPPHRDTDDEAETEDRRFSFEDWADTAIVSPEKQTQLQELLRIVDQAVREDLSARQRQAFRARFVDDRTNDEIAADLGISRGAVYLLIYEGRKKIKRRLLEIGYSLAEFREIVG